MVSRGYLPSFFNQNIIFGILNIHPCNINVVLYWERYLYAIFDILFEVMESRDAHRIDCFCFNVLIGRFLKISDGI
jgi:hypothetical protein